MSPAAPCATRSPPEEAATTSGAESFGGDFEDPSVDDEPPDTARELGTGTPASAGEEPAAIGAAVGTAAAATGHIPAVQVCVRVRPLLDWERAQRQGSSRVQVRSGRRGTVTLLPPPPEEETSGVEATPARASSRPPRQRAFTFDAVLGPESSQQDVWDQVCLGDLVEKVVQGFHATVFAYGQTGSGKTHTMEGFAYEPRAGAAAAVVAPSADDGRPRARADTTPPEQLGIVPRAMRELFARIERLRAKAAAAAEGDGMEDSFAVRVSFLQIYRERVYDLLNPGAVALFGMHEEAAALRLRWDASRGRFYVENLFEFECSSVEDVLKHYAAGVQHKQVAATAMNAASSRSHTILLVTLVHRTALGCSSVDPDQPDIAPAVTEVSSTLALVDLAGSERASASGDGKAGAERFKEAVNINQSLFVLRRVILALSKRSEGQEDQEHVPYRESKLTSLLQHAIGGNGFLLMLACLSPSDRHYEENLSTLQYASQAALIKNQPVVNLDPKDRLIQHLQQQLAAAHAYILHHLGLEELPPELREAAVAPLQLGAAGAGPAGRRLGQRSLANGPRSGPLLARPGPPAWSVDPRRSARPAPLADGGGGGGGRSAAHGAGEEGGGKTPRSEGSRRSASGGHQSAGSRDPAMRHTTREARPLSPRSRLTTHSEGGGKDPAPPPPPHLHPPLPSPPARGGLPPIGPPANFAMYCRAIPSQYQRACKKAGARRSNSSGTRPTASSSGSPMMRLSLRSVSAADLPLHVAGAAEPDRRPPEDNLSEPSRAGGVVQDRAWDAETELQTRRDLESRLRASLAREHELEMRLREAASGGAPPPPPPACDDPARDDVAALRARSEALERERDALQERLAAAEASAARAGAAAGGGTAIGEGSLAKWAQ